MKILVVSDTHGELSGLATVLSRLGGSVDYLVHCGDGAADCERARSLGLICPPVLAVRGNMDAERRIPAFRQLEADGLPILILHGHRYLDSSASLLGLALHGSEQGASLVIFGHTHIPILAEERGLSLLNPGSLSRPRGGHGPSFALLRIVPEGSPAQGHFETSFYELKGNGFRLFDPAAD